MIKFFETLRWRLLIPALLFSFSDAAAAGIATPFEAAYTVYIDGKPRMESVMKLVKDGNVWLLSNTGKGTKGLAKLLGASSEERSIGRIENDQFRTLEYSQHTKIMAKDTQWSAKIDPDGLEVSTVHKDGEGRYKYLAGAVDPLSLTIALRSSLTQGLSQFVMHVIDENEMDHHKFQAGKLEDLQTALGCFKSVKVTRVRENSSRYSSGWYAKDLNYLPVKLLHGKEGGREFEMRITQLRIDGQDIAGIATCSS
ncbi:MAG: hypothetical protein ACI9H8_001100 [Lysobacterales bacterium]